MIQTSHTPGPWEAVSLSGIHGHIAIMARSSDFHDEETWPYHPKIASVACMRGGPSREIGEANARLIAAAPDLLDELKGVIEVLNKPHLNIRDFMPRIEATIAKATGKAA